MTGFLLNVPGSLFHREFACGENEYLYASVLMNICIHMALMCFFHDIMR